jgi:Leucine-rich repeat (LRR) protein
MTHEASPVVKRAGRWFGIQRWMKFRLRTLFISMTLLCIALGWIVGPVRRQSQAVNQLREIGWRVRHHAPDGPNFWTCGNGWSEDSPDFVNEDTWRGKVESALRLRLPRDLFDGIECCSLDADSWQFSRFSRAAMQNGSNPWKVREEWLAKGEFGFEHLGDLQGLERIRLDDIPLKAKALQTLARLRSVKELSLTKCQLEGNDFSFLAALKNLERFSISDMPGDDKLIVTLSGLTKLKSLYLNSGHFTETGLAPLGKLPNLESLTIGEKVQDDSGLKFLPQLQPLQRLTLSMCKVGDEEIRHLATLGNLIDLDLHKTKVTDAGLQHLAGLKKLQHLDLSDTKHISGAGLYHLAGCRVLKTLDLSDSNVTTLSFPQLPALTYLNLKATRIENDALQALRALTALEHLELSETKIGDEGMLHLVGLPELYVIELNKTCITDQGLRTLSRIPNLTSLKLNETPITDEGMEYLESLPRLQQLSLERTQLTDNSLASLSKLVYAREPHGSNSPITISIHLEHTYITEESYSWLYKENEGGIYWRP